MELGKPMTQMALNMSNACKENDMGNGRKPTIEECGVTLQTRLHSAKFDIRDIKIDSFDLHTVYLDVIVTFSKSLFDSTWFLLV